MPTSLNNYRDDDGNIPRKVIIIDDAIAERNQEKLEKYFTSGRHSNCETFYLTHRFYEVPKIIRDQLNLVISFDCAPKTAEALYYITYIRFDLKQFKEWYYDVYKDDNGRNIPKVICKWEPILRNGIANIV